MTRAERYAGAQAGVRGIALIESMVAVVLIAVGMLGVFKLNAYFMASTAEARTRLVAVQLAQAKLEQFRSHVRQDQLSLLEDSDAAPEAIFGYAGEQQAVAFSRWWTVTMHELDGRSVGATVDVYVRWTDRNGNTDQGATTVGPNTVRVSTELQWVDAAKVAIVPVGRASAGLYATPPTGRARVPIAGLDPLTATVETSVTPDAAGLRVQTTADGRSMLVDGSGKVLLIATKPAEPLSWIGGRIYVDQSSLSAITNEEIYIVISDASYCSMLPAKAASGSSPTQLVAYPTASTNNPKYRYMDYRCYVGAAWYGGIGAIRIGRANANDRVCVGDPAVAVVARSVKSDNRHPMLGNIRTYRGYVAIAADTTGLPAYASTGIGIRSDGSYVPGRYDGHDFLLTRLSGNIADADCGPPMLRYDASAPHEPFSTDAVQHEPVTETAYLAGGTYQLGSPSNFFCLSVSCPENVTTTPVVYETSITVTVNLIPSTGSPKASITSLSTGSGQCKASGGSYICTFTGTGFTGDTWDGELTVVTAAGQYVCPKVSGDFMPMPAGPQQPTLDTFRFLVLDQPIDRATASFSFTVGATAANCP